jgi:hypothetical protein
VVVVAAAVVVVVVVVMVMIITIELSIRERRTHQASSPLSIYPVVHITTNTTTASINNTVLPKA